MFYVFVRGAIDHWYPYPVLYSQAGKFTGVVFSVILLASISFILLAQIVAWISRVNRDRQTTVERINITHTTDY